MKVCGIWAPARVIGHAVLELLDAAAGTDTDTTADRLAAHLPAALRVLQQPDRDSGGRAAADQLSPPVRTPRSWPAPTCPAAPATRCWPRCSCTTTARN